MTQKRYELTDKLWILWKEYMDYYVVKNPENKRILFHTFLGILLTQRGYNYIESAKKKSTRLHVFMIQPSGTGKTQCMGALHDLLRFLDVPSRMTIKDNEASLTGTVYLEEEAKTKKRGIGGVITNKKGMLSFLNALLWDEGSSLLRKSNFMQDITDVFQGVMDEPGKVVKGMRLGQITYRTNTTLVAGSYMFPEFGQTLMTKGFLQRMFISKTDLSKKERRDIRIGVNLLKLGQDFSKVDMIKRAIKTLVDKIPEPKDKIICFKKEDVMKFNMVLEDIYTDKIEYQFVGDKQDVLETFFNRLHLLIDKIASQRAIINGKKEVEYDDMMYAKELCEIHITSLLSIFDNVERGRVNNTQDKRKLIILDLIRNATNGMVYKKDLLNNLLDLKRRGGWDFGFKRSVVIIDELIKDNLIHMEKSNSGDKLLIIK